MCEEGSVRRIAFVVASLAFALLPVQASAATPTIQHHTILGGPSTVSGVCAGDFTASSVIPVTETDYFGPNDNVVRISLHATETDTFVGPGGTLTSYPYQYEVELTFDSAGNLVSAFGNGQTLKVLLSDGSLFESAGRVDFLTQNAPFVFGPAFGHTGNLTAFCSALGA